MIEKIIQFAGTVADGKNAFPGIQRLPAIGDFSCLIEIQIPVAHQLCVHAELFNIRCRNQAADRVRDAADAKLQTAAVCNKREYVFRNLPVQLRGMRWRSHRQ